MAAATSLAKLLPFTHSLLPITTTNKAHPLPPPPTIHPPLPSQPHSLYIKPHHHHHSQASLLHPDHDRRWWWSSGSSALLEGVEAESSAMATEWCYPAMWHANVMHFKSGIYNVQVVPKGGENEGEESEEVLIRRFRNEVRKAGVLQECRRRRFFEDSQSKRKRKSRDAAQRNSKRRFHARKISAKDKKKEELKKIKEGKEEEEDNWELPDGEPPY